MCKFHLNLTLDTVQYYNKAKKLLNPSADREHSGENFESSACTYVK